MSEETDPKRIPGPRGSDGDALVAGVAHEVRNSLFAMSANLDSFEAELGDRPAYRELSDALRANVRRLSELVSDLDVYTRPLALTFAPWPLEAALAEAMALASPHADTRGVTLRFEKESDVAPIAMDRHSLVQAFRGLLENAIHRSYRNAAVTLSMRLAGGAPRLVACSLEDEGASLPSEALPRFFEPFFARRRGASGLALAIVRRVAEAHGGSIAAANRNGGGLVVTVTLPLDSGLERAETSPGAPGGGA